MRLFEKMVFCCHTQPEDRLKNEKKEREAIAIKCQKIASDKKKTSKIKFGIHIKLYFCTCNVHGEIL